MGPKVEINYKVNPVKVPLETDHGILESEERKWGMPLKDVYKYGLAFYKEKEGKAIHLSYEDRLKLVAYTQQTVHGPLDPNSASPLGVLDVIGRDRRAAWQALGQMTQIQAMAGFVHTLDRLCPLFRPYLEAIQKDLEAKKQQELKKALEEQSRQELQERVMLEKQKQQNDKSDKPSEEAQVQRIKEALNAQTYEQFLAYAQQQFPGNFDQQAVLIRQLQDQHYQQYIQQLSIDQRLANCSIKDDETPDTPDTPDLTGKDCNLNDTDTPDVDNKAMQTSHKSDIVAEYTEESRGEESDGDDIFPHIEEARMWTSPDIVKFKETARASGGTLTVGHGETITVRVPTHPRANCLCWEFATDNYDIGFGVYFEWSKSPTTEVTIHVADSDEELDDDADDDDGESNLPNLRDYGYYGQRRPEEEDPFYEYHMELESGKRSDPELGDRDGATQPSLPHHKPPVSPVVTIYRRDCHTEVYAGSHTYPGEGVYLLKFDNTYSLWRSKTLYYKVYYTQ